MTKVIGWPQDPLAKHSLFSTRIFQDEGTSEIQLAVQSNISTHTVTVLNFLQSTGKNALFQLMMHTETRDYVFWH